MTSPIKTTSDLKFPPFLRKTKKEKIRNAVYCLFCAVVYLSLLGAILFN